MKITYLKSLNKPKLRILHITPKMTIGGGIENFIYNYYKVINKNLIQFDLLVNSDKKGDLDESFTSLGSKIYYTNPIWSNPFKFLIRTIKILNLYKKYSIVHIHTSSGSKIIDGLIAKILGFKKIIFHSHSNPIKFKFKYYIFQFLFRFIGTDYFACSKNSGIYFFGKKILNNNRFHVIYNAIEVNKYLFNNRNRLLIRDEYGFANKIILGHIGRFTKEKNHMFLVNLMQHLPPSIFHLVLVGEGPLLEKIKNYVLIKKLSNMITFTGLQKNAYKFYSSFDIFLFPSFHEGFGIALLESQASGLISLTFNSVPEEVKVLNDKLIIFEDFDFIKWSECIKSIKLPYNRKINRNIDSCDISFQVLNLEKIYINGLIKIN